MYNDDTIWKLSDVLLFSISGFDFQIHLYFNENILTEINFIDVTFFIMFFYLI